MITEIEYKRVNLLRSTFERKYSMLFAKLLNAQFKSVASKINETNYTEPPLSVIKQEDTEKLFVSLYSTVGSHFASQTYRTNKALTEDELIDNWAKYMQEFVITKKKDTLATINKVTKEQILSITLRAIEEAADEGLGAVEVARFIKERIKQKGEIINSWRALRIARTEVMSASNAGSIKGARDLGVPMDKVWIATIDGRERTWHGAEMNNVSVDINEKFDVSGAKMDCPGDPEGGTENVVNCRCTIAYRVKR